MKKFIPSGNTDFQEILITIYDSEVAYYGGSQYWFPKATHRLSGCGPVAAANITAYLSQTFPEKFHAAYPYDGILNKTDFVAHMVEVRKYVKPGIFGLTSVRQFSDSVLAFARQRGISLAPFILDDNTADIDEAVNFISKALLQKLPVAILVLKHPVKELQEYTWHWMIITDLKLNSKNNEYYITVSTYGERRVINFDLLWNHRRLQDIIRLAYFS